MAESSALNLLIEAIAHTCQVLTKRLEAGEPLPRLGLRRSARLPLLAALYRARKAPILIVTDRADRALTILDELGFWLPEAARLLFPEPTPLFYEDAAWGDQTRRERLTALTELARYQIPGAALPELAPVLVASARAVMTRTLPRRDYLKAARTIKVGQIIQLDQLARLCLSLGYESVHTVIAPGQIARRGGLIDIWPPAEVYPLRLEFFGDEIDTLRFFDPASQRTQTAPQEVEAQRLLITPAREYLLRPEIEQDGERQLSEYHIPQLHPAPASILDYLPRQALVLIDNRQAFEEAVTETEAQAVKMRQEAIKEGVLPEDFPVPYLTLDDLQDAFNAHQALDLGPAVHFDPASESELAAQGLLGERFEAGPRFGGHLKAFMELITDRFLKGESLVIVSRQAARLQELWAEQRVSAIYHPSLAFIEGSLADGWVFTAASGQVIHLLTDGEIFGWRRPEPRRRPKRYAEAPEANYSDLQIGDYVVHVDHGIGRYNGLVRRTVDRADREYLSVEFADEAELFVPVHQADRLTRYVGPDNRTPTLSRLGSPEWRTSKASVKQAVQDVAQELLELYAARSVVAGHAFDADSIWQQELEASFPYVETEDQMRVLADVKRDMQAARPMDRLICGDVGYGKTEVALRAAFKSVMDGKQVAMLVPTTVLAQQHFHTFTQRLAAFPVTVEMLSRFRTPQQQRQIVTDLGRGKIDILIGTHRMLSSDVQFNDLGLLIIDEEQRFGVTHKEQLKQLRKEVDVLTLTATPIPRTLYMALSGVRDISTINTPPEERLPIVTHVGPYSPRLVKQAILRELDRGGQVFFVHNRVQTISAMLMHLRQLIPEARLAIAHGQMDETELAHRMEAFTKGEVDVLLTTSIIESGLDIPNANTLIVDRADTFGLAQLYQLRGRVGRGAQRAYAYFFRHNQKAPTYDGRQRLETIAENTQLGAGYSIAMRDLEIRGTGDILGTRQHGHIAAVGFHLYTSLLAQAVQRLRQEQNLKAAPMPASFNLQFSTANVELPIAAAIPAEYIPDKKTRLGLYRRMANVRALPELEAMLEEFIDRFGPPPETVLNLFLQFKIKLLAEQAGLATITVENRQIVLRYPDGIVPEDLPLPGPPVRVGKSALWLPYSDNSNWTTTLMETLNRLNRNQPVALVEAG